MRIIQGILAAVFASGTASAQAANKIDPDLSTPKLEMQFDGFIGNRLRANVENWELRVPDANPALIEMFSDRERKPDRKLLPWSGEFVGKYLCASILSYRILHEPRQKELISRIEKEFLATQDRDGYLGPFDRNSRLTGRNWDIWGHYWAIRALLLYHEEFGAAEALNAATRAADLLVARFLDRDTPLTNDGSFGQMNYAVIHAFTKLYRVTGKPQYLDMARWIVKEWDRPGAGLYMRSALAGKEMFEFPGNRWESVHDFQGMYDMYLLTGEPKFKQAFTHIWYSILKGDRHNTGGFTSGERTTGDSYDTKAIETCCTVAWLDMSIDMLKLTADSKVADELELSTFNGMVGGQTASGRWWTYNTPMDGVKEASAHTINFQCRPGSPELNCCSVNGPRGLAMLSEWALLRSHTGFVLNYYGPASFKVRTRTGQVLTIREQTDYPLTGKVSLKLSLENPEAFNLNLRVPSWSAQTKITLNAQSGIETRPGIYLSLDRRWKDGDAIDIELDMSPHFWVGERELYGKTSVYRGPILLAFDPTYNSMDPDDIPELDARNMELSISTTPKLIQPWILVSTKAPGGQEIKLCDFASAGAYGNFYRSWIRIGNVGPIPFDRARPVWDNRPGFARPILSSTPAKAQ